jgi:hypothetical protein
MFIPPSCKLNDDEYLIALRIRLLIPLHLVYDGSLQCSCGLKISQQSFTHPLDCARSAGEKNIRHNACRDAVMIHYNRAFPDLGSVSEPNLVLIDPSSKRRSLKRGDLAIKTVLGNEIIIDFAVTNPSASSFLAYPHCSHLHCNKANDHQEKVKRMDYINVVPSVLQRLLIFSTEATGRIGSRAKSFLDKLLPASSSNSPRYKSLLKQLESICMKFNAQMIYKRLCSTSHISDPTQKLLQTTAHSSIM